MTKYSSTSSFMICTTRSSTTSSLLSPATVAERVIAPAEHVLVVPLALAGPGGGSTAPTTHSGAVVAHLVAVDGDDDRNLDHHVERSN